MKVMVIPIVFCALVTVPKDLEKRLGELEIKGRIDHPDHSIVEITKNTQKSPGDLRRLAVTLTSVKNHPLNYAF